MMALTWDGSNAILYKNDETPQSFINAGSGGYQLFLGTRGGVSEYFDGNIGKIYVTDYAMTQDMISYLYNLGR
jgi:hypothetical protein